MTTLDLRSELSEHLETLNQAVLGKLDGLSEYDLRRPMTPTGTNLLGVVKHLPSVQAGYFGETIGCPFPRNVEMTWRTDEKADPQDDLWVKPDRDLDAPGAVPWWTDPDVTLGQILVHMTDETARHAGHMDIVRELIDGAVGRYARDRNIVDGSDWVTYWERVEAGAVAAQGASGS